jgi:hypothetical protein
MGDDENASESGEVEEEEETDPWFDTNSALYKVEVMRLQESGQKLKNVNTLSEGLLLAGQQYTLYCKKVSCGCGGTRCGSRLVT